MTVLSDKSAPLGVLQNIVQSAVPTAPADRISSDVVVQALLEISNLVGSSEQIDRILKRIVQITAELMQMPICSIYLVEPDGTLRKRSNVGLQQDLRTQASFKLGEGIPGWVAQHGELVALADVTKDPRYGPHPVALKEPHAYICAPLQVRGQIIGVLTARQMAVKPFTRTQRKVFETVAKMIAIVIEKHRLIREKVEAEQLAAVATSLSEIAHYAKNVIFTTMLAEETISEAFEKEPALARFRDSWRALKRSNQRIRKLVEDMLNYCRDRELKIEEVNLNDLVKEAAKDLSDHAVKHGVEIMTELDANLGCVRLDRSAMYDVLLNLITNGIDAIPEGRSGRVIIRTKLLPEQGQYVVSVEDNGSGIPANIRKKIFTLFFSTKGERGSGIGLAASRKAVERHGGRIDFTTRVNEGTTFTVTMPLSPSAVV
ncbi:MAG: ATP-binding protein [Kiritimatiellae bacterium]|nr:ATP-binding protein [Kiritimatiellia bacterium]